MQLQPAEETHPRHNIKKNANPNGNGSSVGLLIKAPSVYVVCQRCFYGKLRSGAMKFDCPRATPSCRTVAYGSSLSFFSLCPHFNFNCPPRNAAALKLNPTRKRLVLFYSLSVCSHMNQPPPLSRFFAAQSSTVSG